jgi:hypothetical protein
MQARTLRVLHRKNIFFEKYLNAWYTQIVNEARSQHYEPKVAFVYDGGEAWYRNSVLRDRALPADGYINFMRAYDTFWNDAQKHGIHAK